MEGTRSESLTYQKEEYLNAATHGFGVLLTLVGAPILLYYTWKTGSSVLFYSVLVFCFASLLVYTTSTLYHAAPPGELKSRLLRIDHMSIYLMIAGTHTPFVIKYLDSQLANAFLIVLWLMAFTGVIYKLFFFERFKNYSTGFYLGLGWMSLITITAMFDRIPLTIILLMLAGGFAYSVGVLFYRWRGLAYHHAIWHIFVLIGSITHYMAICYMII